MGVFNWFKSKFTVESNDVTKQPARRPNNVDRTSANVANSELTRALYHNTYPGMKLAGGLAFPPIAVPLWLMGIPTAESIEKNESIQGMLDEITEQNTEKMESINKTSHIEGCLWVWPKWSTKKNNTIWEFIPDSSVTDIIRDLNTGDIISIITDEDITVATGYNKTATVRRKRTFTKTRIDISYTGGAIPSNLKDKSMRNPLHILPINFKNNADFDEVRGHSDYERILSDLKDYHDIDLARSTMLAKFSPKMLQQVTKLQDWLANNGYDSLTDVDIQATDFIVNVGDQEKTEFVFPERAYEAYSQTLIQKFQKIVEASGVPEIVWGLKTSGNHASAEESMASLVHYVRDKQRQKNKPYQKLFEADLALRMASQFNTEKPTVKITWNKLDALSDETKSNVFKNFAQGISFIVGSAGGTKEQIYKLWQSMYPETTTEDFKQFEKGLGSMAEHKQYVNSAYIDTQDFRGDEE